MTKIRRFVRSLLISCRNWDYSFVDEYFLSIFYIFVSYNNSWIHNYYNLSKLADLHIIEDTST